MLEFLTVDDVIDIHDTILSTEAGRAGIYHEKVAAVVGRVELEEDYQGFESAFHLAAAYIEALAVGHAFVDANKRTAFTCGMVILEINGFPIPDKIKNTISNETSAWSKTIVSLVEKKITREHLTNLMILTYFATAGAIGLAKLANWLKDKLSD